MRRAIALFWRGLGVVFILLLALAATAVVAVIIVCAIAAYPLVVALDAVRGWP